jgi:hypothetical protein
MNLDDWQSRMEKSKIMDRMDDYLVSQDHMRI